MLYRTTLAAFLTGLLLCVAACEPERGGEAELPLTQTELLAPGALCITTQALPAGRLNKPYSQIIRGAGGSGSGYAWSATGLPPGLALGASGTPSTALSGRPTVPGTFNLTIQLIDSAGASFSRPFTLCALAFQLDSWEPCGLPGAPVDHRGVAAWTGKYLLEWGGQTSSGMRNEGTVYSPKFCLSRPMTTQGSPALRWGESGVWCDTWLAVWGGRDVSGSAPELADGGLYEPVGDSWTPISALGAPRARYNHSAAWSGSEMLVFGGTSTDPVTGTFDSVQDLHAYNPATGTWRAINPTGTAPGPREGAFMACDRTAGCVIVFGGIHSRSPGSADPYQDGGIYNPSNGTWARIPDVPSGVAGVWWQADQCAWTGTDLLAYNVLTGLWRYDAIAGQWSQTAPVPQLESATVAWTGTLLMLTGVELTAPFQNVGHVYNESANLWSPFNMTGATVTATTYFQRSFWVGPHLMVWGGATLTPQGFDYASSGGLYHP